MLRILFLPLLLVLTSCAATSGYPTDPVDANTQLSSLRPYFDSEEINKYQNSTDPTVRKMLRNEIIYGRVAAYDVEFANFQAHLNQERILPDSAADAAIAIMGGAGAALTDKAVKSALLGATSAVSGVKGAVDKDVFYHEAMTALFAQMSANRAAVLADIDKGTLLSDAAYPLTRGLIDTDAYREAGSIPGALAGIAHDAGKKQQAAKAQISGIENARLAIEYKHAIRQ